MNRSRPKVIAVLLSSVTTLIAFSGCASATTATPMSSRSVAAPTLAELRAGVVAALHANHAVSVRVLWTNRIPTSAQESTRGPALAALRASGEKRTKQQVRVRMLHDSYRILSIQLNKTHRTATAVAQSIQKVVPTHLNGKPLGHAINLNERASILLHRIGSSSRFVVWKVALLK